MHDVILTVAGCWTFFLLAVLLVTLIRTPFTLTRIAVLDAATLMLTAVLILYGTREDEPFYLDAALVVAALSFVSTVAAARYQAEGRPY